MDSLDRQLLALLRHNARESVVMLARKLKVSRGTVQNRIARMLAKRQILGFTVWQRNVCCRIQSSSSVRKGGDQ